MESRLNTLLRPSDRKISKFYCSKYQLSNSSLSTLAVLPNLSYLELPLFDQKYSLPTPLGTKTFSSLRDLLIEYMPGNAIAAINFLTGISTDCLTCLKINFVSRFPMAELERLALSVAKFRQLTELDLDFTKQEEWQSSQRAVGGHVLHPLCAIRDVEYLYLRSIPIMFSREDLEQMASSWGKVKWLTLDTLHAGIALEDLTIFGGRCERMLRLDVQIKTVKSDWAWPPPHRHSADISILRHGLQSLDLLRSVFPPTAAEPVAIFLSDLFPEASIWHNHSDTDPQDRQDPAHPVAVIENIKAYKERLTESPQTRE